MKKVNSYQRNFETIVVSGSGHFLVGFFQIEINSTCKLKNRNLLRSVTKKQPSNSNVIQSLACYKIFHKVYEIHDLFLLSSM